jgi:hypothetical protein
MTPEFRAGETRGLNDHGPACCECGEPSECFGELPESGEWLCELCCLEDDLPDDKKNVLMVMLATGVPVFDLGGKWEKLGLVGENGTLTEKGKKLARRLAVKDPEVTPGFKAMVEKGLR